MKPRVIKPVPLTAEAFAPYGDVIEARADLEQIPINYGQTNTFNKFAKVDVTAEGGETQLRIFRTTPLPRPLQLKIMERHPLGSQAFVPLGDQPYMVAVAEKGDLDPKKIKVFLAQPNQGVNYHAGTWHHYSLALNEVSDFLVIDRGGPGKNCDEIPLEGDDAISVDY
jgi:ureidoglycolate lyase